jgi:hypothetical protein
MITFRSYIIARSAYVSHFSVSMGVHSCMHSCCMAGTAKGNEKLRRLYVGAEGWVNAPSIIGKASPSQYRIPFNDESDYLNDVALCAMDQNTRAKYQILPLAYT